MKRALYIALATATLITSQVEATELTGDVGAECKIASTPAVPSCECWGQYFVSKFGMEEGVAALHLVSRSYAAQTNADLAGLYERFKAPKLHTVANRILETRGEVASYCPFSASLDD